MPEPSAETLFNKGVSLLAANQTIEGLETLKQALSVTESETDKGSIYYNMAVCHIRLKDDGAAIDQLKNAISSNPMLVSHLKDDDEFSQVMKSKARSELLVSMTRPKALTAIGWFIVVSSTLSLVLMTIAMSMTHGRLPSNSFLHLKIASSTYFAYGFVYCLYSLLCAQLLLDGRSVGRSLLLSGMVAAFFLQFLMMETHWFSASKDALWTLVFAYFLTRQNVNLYFDLKASELVDARL